MITTCPQLNSPCYFCSTLREGARNALKPENYGTGKLEAVSSLTADIMEIVSNASKIALGFLLSTAKKNALGTFVKHLAGKELWYLTVSTSVEFMEQKMPDLHGFSHQMAFGHSWDSPNKNERTQTAREQCVICGDNPTGLEDVDWRQVTPDDFEALLNQPQEGGEEEEDIPAYNIEMADDVLRVSMEED